MKTRVLPSRLYRASGPLLALSLVLHSAAPAAGEETPTLGSSQPMARYRQAHAAMESKDWHEARAVLFELWQGSRTYDVAASLAQVEHALGDDVAAARYLTFAVAHLAPKERPETLERYRAALDELKAEIGRVEVNVSHPSAEVRIDGNLVGLSPVSPVFVEPGEHVVEARLGNQVASSRIAVAKGWSSVVELSLAPPLADAPRAPEAPEAPEPLPPLRAPVYDAPDDERSRRSVVPLYVGGGVALVGAGMALGFGLAANADEEKADALRARLGPTGCSTGTATRSACEAAGRARDVQRRHAMLSTIGVGVAAAGALATVGYWLFWPQFKSSRSTAWVQPSAGITRGGADLSVVGEF